MEDEKKWDRLSITLTPELKEEIKTAMDQSGLKQADFLTSMLTAYRQVQAEDPNTGTPEIQQVRAQLNKTLILVESVINRAVNQETQAKEDIRQSLYAFDQEKKKLQAEIEDLTQRLKTVEEENVRLKEEQESRESLKDAWKERESDYKQKLTDQAKHSNENIQLRKEIDDLKEKFSTEEKEHQLALKDMEIKKIEAVNAAVNEVKKDYEAKLEGQLKEMKVVVQAFASGGKS